MKKEDYISKIITELKLKDYSNRTIESYLYFLGPFLDMVNNPSEATLDEIKKFLSTLVDRYNNRSRALAVSSVRFFFKRVIDRPEIYTKLDIPKKQKIVPQVLSKEEIKLLINATKIQKTQLIIKMLYSSGLRVSELTNLRVGDLDLPQSIGWVRKGKGSKDRIFKIADLLKEDLKKCIDKHPSNNYLFSEKKPLSARNIQLLVSSTAKRAGINKKVTPHTLRHSFATHLLEAGENLLVIQNLLGHENIETTKIYLHISKEQIKNVKSPLDML